MLAAAADGDEGHFRPHHLPERAADPGLAGVAVAGTHSVRGFIGMCGSRRRRPQAPRGDVEVCIR